MSEERETLVHEMALLAEHRYLNSDTGDGIIEMVEPWCAELAHLRQCRENLHGVGEEYEEGIKRMQDELAHLRRELEESKENHVIALESWKAEIGFRKEAEQERDRYKAALEQIWEEGVQTSATAGHLKPWAAWARDALKGETDVNSDLHS